MSAKHFIPSHQRPSTQSSLPCLLTIVRLVVFQVLGRELEITTAANIIMATDLVNTLFFLCFILFFRYELTTITILGEPSSVPAFQSHSLSGLTRTTGTGPGDG